MKAISPNYRRLLRRILAIEHGLRGWTPRAHAGPEMPEMPDGAEAVLAAVAARHAPGSKVGLADIAEAAGVSRSAAGAVRRWARAAGPGRWPYRDGAPRRAEWSDLDELVVEGGGS